jgi:hypothetical protein
MNYADVPSVGCSRQGLSVSPQSLFVLMLRACAAIAATSRLGVIYRM